MLVRNNGAVVADIPAKKLADEAPIYQREAHEPEYLKQARAFALHWPGGYERATEGSEATTELAGHRVEKLGLPPIRPDCPRLHRRLSRLMTRQSSG
jgi:hypothetical protein